MKVTAFRHVGITVSDMQRSLDFYTKYLGMEVMSRHPDCRGAYYESLVGVPGADINIVVLRMADGARLELLQYRSHPRREGAPANATEPGRPHCAFTVEDLMALYRDREAYGCSFKHPPLKSPDGVLVAYCHDPDGTILELVQPAEQ